MFLFVTNLTLNEAFCGNYRHNFVSIKKSYDNNYSYKIPKINPPVQKDSYSSTPKFDSYNSGLGQFSEKTGRLRTKPVSPHNRKNGTFVNPYWRS